MGRFRLFGDFVSDSVANQSRSGSTGAGARAGRRGVTRVLALALLAASLGACTELNLFHKDEVAPDEPADRLYNEGLYLLNEKKDYKAAVKKFEEVDRQHPYSEWARKALLMSAYAYYQGSYYDETIAASNRYVTLHPGSTDAAYAQYLMAAAYFDEIPDVTRDPSLGQAHLVFQVQNGIHRIISPPPYAESTFRVPSREDAPLAHRPAGVSGSAHRD